MSDGTVGLCGHMIGSPKFNSLQELEKSSWLNELKNKIFWSPECIRCQQEENLGKKSIRQHSIERHKILSSYNSEYLIIGGVLDNICNSACQFCDENLSTKIGNLKYGKNYKLINNYDKFIELPQDRIIELDINGGEPSNSPNYQLVLDNLPPNLKILRINTNASKYITNLDSILKRKIKVFITISLDGVGKIFEYTRHPLKWDNFVNIVDKYSSLSIENKFLSLNFWTTVSVYTIGDLPNIINFAKEKQIELSYGFLHEPDPLNIIYKNPITMSAKNLFTNKDENLFHLIGSSQNNSDKLLNYMKIQDKIRGTNYEDCYNWS